MSNYINILYSCVCQKHTHTHRPKVILPFSSTESCMSGIVTLKRTSRLPGSLETQTHMVRAHFACLSVQIRVFSLPFGHLTETHWLVEIDEVQYCFKRVLQQCRCPGLLFCCTMAFILLLILIYLPYSVLPALKKYFFHLSLQKSKMLSTDNICSLSQDTSSTFS